MLKQRIKKLEKIMKPEHGGLRLWILRGPPEEQERQIMDIEAGGVRNRNGSLFSPQDRNYYLSEKFIPTIPEEGEKNA